MQRFKVVFLILGLVLLAYAIKSLGGFAAIALPLLQMRWWLLLAIVSTLVAQLMRTLAWSRLLDSYGGQIPFLTLWRVRLIGEALNYLSFAGPFLGDPTKAWLLSSETGFKKAGASVALDRYLYSISTILFIAAVAVAWFARWGVMIAVGVTLAVAISPFFVARYSGQIPPSRLYAVAGLHLFSHVFMVLEVVIILRGLNTDVTLLQAFFVEAMTKGMNGLFFFVPAQIGVSEGSHAAFLHYLKIAGATGLTLGIARRIRSLFWSALGLALLLKSRRWSRDRENVVIGNDASQQISE